MEDMNKTNEIAEVENIAEVEETSEKGGYAVLLLVAGAGAIAGHFVEKGAKMAWSWIKGKMADAKIKKARAEEVADEDDAVADAES